MGTNISQCKDCNAEIVWMLTANGKNIAVDLDSAENELDIDSDVKIIFDKRSGHRCHWDICPYAKKSYQPKVVKINDRHREGYL